MMLRQSSRSSTDVDEAIATDNNVACVAGM